MTYFEPIELETTAAVLALQVTNILVTFGRRSTTRLLGGGERWPGDASLERVRR